MGSPSSGRSAFVGSMPEQQVADSMVGVPAFLADANYGLLFDEINPGKYASREGSPIKNPALTGSSLEAASIPGPSTFPGDFPRPARVSSLISPFATITGKPTPTYPNHVDTPAAPVITHGGTPGTTSVTYKVVHYGPDGSVTAASPAGTTGTSAASLDETDYNTITPTHPAGSTHWDVWRTAAAGTPSTTGKLNAAKLPVATLDFDDTGLAPVAGTTTPPTVNKTDTVVKYLFPFSDLSADAVTESYLVHVGGDMRPMVLTGFRASGIDLANNGGMITMSVKGEGTGATLLGPGVADGGNTGTYAYAPILKGRVRTGHAALTYGIDWKVTQAVTGGVLKIKAKAGNAATFDGSEISIYVSATTGKVIQGGSNGDVSGGVELTDENNLPFGPDSTDRESLVILLAGDLNTLAVDDLFHHDIAWPVPGLGSSPYTGVARAGTTGTRLTLAHVRLLVGGAYFEMDNVTVKFSGATTAYRPTGPGWKRPGAIYVNGFQSVDLEPEHLWCNRELEEAQLSGELVTVELTIAGGRIPFGDGTFSSNRETLFFSHSAMQVEKVDAAVTGPAPSKEKATLSVKAASNGAVPVLYGLCGDLITFPSST